VAYDYWHDYRFFDHRQIEPRYPYGFGLSYTTFKYTGLALGRKKLTGEGTLAVKVTVKNTGPMDGDEVVQLYISYENSKIVPRPLKELKGFKRVFIRKGKEVTVSFKIKAEDLAWYNPERRRWEVEKMKYRVLAGPSSAALPLEAVFSVG
jgi:beta-glucosidase